MAIDIVQSMRVFSAVVEAGSFAGGADRMGLSRGMATRYVAQLEAHLGVRLLHRTTRSLSLSPPGNDYYARAHQILGLIADAESSAASESAMPRGTLRVTTPSIFGTRHLAPASAAFIRQYPAIEVDLSISERVVDLVEEGFDLALRVTQSVAPGLIARRLAPVRLVACAAPSYLRRHGTPREPEDLARHACLVYSGSTYRNEWRFRRDGDERVVKVSGPLRGNSGDVLLAAALAGLGVVYEPSFLVYEALRARQLVPVVQSWTPDEFGLYAVYANRRFLPPKVRRYIDFLAERFGPAPYWDAEPAASRDRRTGAR